MLPHLGLGELIVLLVIVLLLFGPQRLPDLASSLGKSVRLFKEGMREEPKTETKPEKPA